MRAKYQRYIELKDAGLKQQAKRAAMGFVEEYKQQPDEEFLLEICDFSKGRINHQIWSEVVFPMALADRENPLTLKCLILTIQNLMSDRRAHERLGWVGEGQLLDEYLALRPGDPWAVARRKRTLADWLGYVIHEWPKGVLYGVDGATIPECQEILNTVAVLRAMDGESEYGELCDDVERKTMAYREKLVELEC